MLALPACGERGEDVSVKGRKEEKGGRNERVLMARVA